MINNFLKNICKRLSGLNDQGLKNDSGSKVMSSYLTRKHLNYIMFSQNRKAKMP